MASPDVLVPAIQPSAQATAHLLGQSKPPSYTFAFDDFLRREYRFGLDNSRPLCKAFVQGHCPLGSSCPDRHIAPAPTYNNLVCKHWLRGLCKKGDACEFLHEYNVRKMPECTSYARNQWCSNGEDCLYSHVDNDTRLERCPHYDKGYCPLGDRCSKRHIRKTICKFYLAGFCPRGKECPEGAHPRWPTDLPDPTVRVERDPAEVERERQQRIEQGEREEEREREKDRQSGNRRDWRRTGGVGGGNRGYRNRRHDRDR